MGVSSISVTSTPTVINQGGAKDLLIQNSFNGNTIYVSDTPNLTVSSYSIQVLAGTPLEWPAGSPCWAVCAAGQTSSVTVLDNGATMGVSVTALQAAINTLITVTQTSSTPQPVYFAAAAANTLYETALSLTPSLYTVACVNTTIARVDFFDTSNNYIATLTTVSGTVQGNIATTVGSIKYWTNTGSNINISITKNGSSVAPVSGTLYTFTTSQTITLVGYAYVILVGGGGPGGASITGYGYAGGGGGSGGVVFGTMNLTGSLPLVIGAAGSGSNQTVDGSPGGSTTLNGLVATGGGPGGWTVVNNPGGGTAGTPGGGVGGGGVSGATNATASQSASAAIAGQIPFTLLTTLGTTGGGAGGASAAAGSGIGTGGGQHGGAATGKGSGGGGASSSGENGGNGAPGVCYILL